MSASIGALAAAHLDNATLQDDMRALYDDVDRQIAAHQPNCRNRGQCCNFQAYGHRLYVSTVELSHFVSNHADSWRGSNATAGQCPYQVDGKCTARESRPLGCRIFFCESETAAWPNEIYEAALERSQQIATSHSVEYRYVEWLSALASVPAEVVKPYHPEISAGQKIDPLSLPVINYE